MGGEQVVTKDLFKENVLLLSKIWVGEIAPAVPPQPPSSDVPTTVTFFLLMNRVSDRSLSKLTYICPILRRSLKGSLFRFKFSSIICFTYLGMYLNLKSISIMDFRLHLG